ncbi:polysaccharide deacetylase [Ruminiclostridium sufflavum DSM 19573]|uniref:Polysaccharide deacetylase n=1 Tax=Ruminiclostridium sufflavum DSM 19573 TaxID=1121337 RepID=A0A318XKF2_9FIRM|nr:polysaccharide deacetylase family protein [Ruminiclostridium sufflavum]PYG87841.1 polysaccharide deacetylase [Ruminiclostridium sufflavum DSM 19573]
MFIILNNKAKRYIGVVMATVLIFCFSFLVLFSVSKSVFNDTQTGILSEDKVLVPIVMYHSILKKSAEMGKYVITPREFENDLIYLKNHNYKTINMTDLINYVYHNSEIPPKPVIITFDDGNLNNYIYGKPLLEKYEMKAVISVVGKYSEQFSDTLASNIPPTNNPNYAYASWEQIKEMSSSGYFEIQNHTYNLHSTGKRLGIKRKKGENTEAYKDMLKADIIKLQDKLTEVTGIRPNTFTYPFGYISKESKEVLKSLDFKATLSCAEGVNIINKDKEDTLFGLKRNNRPHGISSENFFEKICP